jgi:hypothetical protein
MFSVHVLRMELNLYCFCGNVFHTSSFLDQNIGVSKLDVVTRVYAVLGSDDTI